MERNDIFIGLGHALIAVFGSCVKWLNNHEKDPRLVLLISEAASAAFSGLLVFFVYSWLEMNVYLAFCVAGALGNLGAKGVDVLGKAIIKNSGIKDLMAKGDKESGA